MADLFTVPPLPQTSYSVDLYNADTFVLRTVVSLVCPFDSGKTSPCEKLYSTGTSVYQGEFYWFERIPTSIIRTSLSIGSRDVNAHNPYLLTRTMP